VKIKAKRLQLETGDELGVEWERWADGRAWRLKRKRDYGDVDPGVAMEAAVNAANRMGKAVRTVRDRYFPQKYFWVQFADGAVRAGEPCGLCGGRRLFRLHPHFLRCAQCGRMLLETDSDDEEDNARAAARLRNLTNVRLVLLERSGELDAYRGCAESDGQPVVVFADFRVEGGEPLGPEEAFERVAKLRIVPYDILSDLFDISALRNGSRDWDLAL
jgi:hypothetical protein